MEQFETIRSRAFAERQRAQIDLLRLPSGSVPRESLIRRLDRLDPLTVLQAPPGMGKTTLLADWARQLLERRDAVIWLQASAELDSVDAATVAIARLVFGPELASQATAAELRTRITEFFTAGAPHRIVLIVDGAQLLTSVPLMQWLLSLVHEHANVHLAAAYDAVWPPTDDLLGSGLTINRIAGQHLVIPPPETMAFATSWGHTVTEEELARLHGLSGGWPLLMRTMLDAPSDFTDVNMVYGLDRFRIEQTAGQISDHLVDIAAPLALIDSVRLDLVEAVHEAVPQLRERSNQADLQAVLGILADAGMLVPVDDADSLQFPAGIRRHLAHVFETRYGEDVRAVHAAVAAHYYRLGRTADVPAMLRHARLAQDWGLLEHVAARRGWWTGARHGETAYQVYGDIPQEVTANRPVLLVVQALVHSLPVAVAARPSGNSGRSEQVQRVLERAGGLDPASFAAGSDRDAQAFLMTSAMNGRRQRGDLAGARRISDHFRNNLLRGRRTGLSSLNLAMYYLQSAFIELASGDLDHAVRRFTRAHEESVGEEAQMVGISASAHLALLFAHEGRSTAARGWLERTEQSAIANPWTAGLIAGPQNLAAALLAMDEYDADEAQHLLDRAGSLSAINEVWSITAFAHARYALLFGSPVSALSSIEHAVELRSGRAPLSPMDRILTTRARCELLLAEGELNRAHRALAAAVGRDPVDLQENSLAGSMLSVPHARMHLIAGNHEDARAVVSAALATRRTQRTEIELLLIDAVAALTLNHHAEAVKSFRRAVTLAHRSRVHTVLLALDAMTRTTLIDLSENEWQLELPGARELLRDSPGIFPERAELVTLTERESAVLRALADGASIPQIAERHVLSANTVKKQTVSLYRKLGTDNRAEAVRRAYELLLIEAPDSLRPIT